MFDFTVNCNSPLVCGSYNFLLQKVENREFDDYAQNLSLDYISASNKEGFLVNVDKFLDPTITKSCVFELFTQDVDECEALKLIRINGFVDGLKVSLKEKGLDVLAYKAKDKLSKLF